MSVCRLLTRTRRARTHSHATRRDATLVALAILLPFVTGACLDSGGAATVGDCNARPGEICTGDYMKGARLPQADFFGGDLSRSDLSDSVLTGANFTGARLVETNLSHADLRGAQLANADLRRANLTGAQLTGADLTGAALDGAKVLPAQLTSAKVCMTFLADAAMSSWNC